MKIILSFLTLILISAPLQSQTWQWVGTNGPPGAKLFGVSVKNNEVFSTGYSGGFFRSIDTGRTWSRNYTPYAALDSKRCGEGIVAGNFITRDIGNTWETIVDISLNNSICRLVTEGSNMFAATLNHKFYTSADCGETWKNQTFNVSGYWSGSDLIKIDSAIFLSVWAKGIYYKTLKDTSWELRNNGLQLGVSCLFGTNNFLYAGTSESGIYFSNNMGLTWMKEEPSTPYSSINCLSGDDSVIYAGTANGLYKSKINSHKWTLVSTLNPFFNITGIGEEGSNIFVATTSDGLWYSSNSGYSWNYAIEPSLGIDIKAISSSDNYLFASAAHQNRFYRSNNLGKDWDLTDNKGFSTLFYHNNKLYGAWGYGVWKSEDEGKSWTFSKTGLPNNIQITKFAAINNTLFALRGGLFKSSDDGQTWVQLTPPDNRSIVAITSQDNSLFTVTSQGVYRSNDLGYSWQTVSPNATSGTGYTGAVAGTHTLFLNTYFHIYCSTDLGANWIQLSRNNLPEDYFYDFIDVLDNEVVAKILSYGQHGELLNHGLFRYRDDEWELLTTTTPLYPGSIIKHKGEIFGAVWPGVAKVSGNVVGIIENNLGESLINIYPNPTSNKFTLNTNTKKEIELKIFNLIGQEIFRRKFLTEIEIDLSNYSKGLYIIEIYFDDRTEKRKIILE
jgi:photosystem II stability/assembly factor-like uncharacterized protein